MRRLLLALFFSCSLPCLAQDAPPEPPVEEKKPPEIIQWAIAPQVVSKNIHFILDRSGSMTPDQLASAMSCFLTVAEQSVDEINIAITIFGADAVRWDGVPDERTPKGWASLPSQTSLDAAKAWLAATTINASATQVSSALSTVDTSIIERPGSDINEITVIIISDLMFDNFPQALLGSLKNLRETRTANGAKDFSLGFIGVHTSAVAVERVGSLCQQENGWIGFITEPRLPTNQEELPATPLPDPDPPSLTPDPLPRTPQTPSPY